MRRCLPILLAVFLFFEANAQSITAQYSTFSPYSIFGLGQKRFHGTAESFSMGGAGGAYSSAITINLQNPASLSMLGCTSYIVGFNYEDVSYRDNTGKDKSSNAYLNNIVLGFPILKSKKYKPKLGITMGMMPYSVVGYNIYNNERINLNDGYGDRNKYTKYEGHGGLSEVFLGAGYNIIQNWSIGVTASYIFGPINRSTYSETEDILLKTRIDDNHTVAGFDFKLGTQYWFKLSKKLFASVGVTYSISAGFRDKQEYNVYQTDMEDTNYATESLVNSTQVTERFQLPSTFSVGIGIGNSTKWFAGAQYESSEPLKVKGLDYYGGDGKHIRGDKISAGFTLTPNTNSVTSYMARINYRIGGYYEQTGLVVNDTKINDRGITIGAALPITKRNSQTLVSSTFNIFFNYGIYGTLENQLTRENYFRIGVSFAINDLWFRKVKYN